METNLAADKRLSSGECKTSTQGLWCAVIALVALVALVAIVCTRAVRSANEHAANESDRAESLADTLIGSPAAAVPFVLEDLRPIQQLARARLRHHFDASGHNSVERLHAAFGLIEMDHNIEAQLLEEVSTAPESECRNLIQAFSHVNSSAVIAIAIKSGDSADPAHRARHAILALHLGDPGPAELMLGGNDNPADRTAFIDTYGKWHGNPDDVADLLLTTANSTFRSQFCIALGTIDSAERGRIPKALARLYNEASDGGTHSAAVWALREWNLPIPAVKSMSQLSTEGGWFVNGQGMTMVGISAGKFVMGTKETAPFDDESPAHPVQLTHPYFLADREVTVEQFLRFLADMNHPLPEKPREWLGISEAISPTGDCPVQMVNWFDAILYCNWLSLHEGRQPCYLRIGKQFLKNYKGLDEEHDLWSCDFTTDGYRLPTEAEWEFAARATSSASFCFGDGTSQLSHYAWFRSNSGIRTWPGGLKRPDAWGLFDMHGNVAEWCWDFEGPYSLDSVSDPTGPKTSATHVLRGGAASVGDLGCRCAYRSGHLPAFRSAWNGFRVCCRSSQNQPTQR